MAKKTTTKPATETRSVAQILSDHKDALEAAQKKCAGRGQAKQVIAIEKDLRACFG